MRIADWIANWIANWIVDWCALNPQSSPQPATRNPQPAIRSPQSAARNPQPAIRSPQSAIRNPQSAILLAHPGRIAARDGIYCCAFSLRGCGRVRFDDSADSLVLSLSKDEQFGSWFDQSTCSGLTTSGCPRISHEPVADSQPRRARRALLLHLAVLLRRGTRSVEP